MQCGGLRLLPCHAEQNLIAAVGRGTLRACLGLSRWNRQSYLQLAGGGTRQVDTVTGGQRGARNQLHQPVIGFNLNTKDLSGAVATGNTFDHGLQLATGDRQRALGRSAAACSG